MWGYKTNKKYMKGGMQTSGVKEIYCACNKPTSKKVVLGNEEISIHFTKKSTYWHITKNNITKRTTKIPPLFLKI